MNKILEIIYQSYLEAEADVSPLETPETFEAFHDFIDTYLGDDMPYTKSCEAQESFALLLNNYRLTAFTAGFYTAVNLLMGGGQM